MLDLEPIGIASTLLLATFFKLALCDRRSLWEPYSRPKGWTDGRKHFQKPVLPLTRESKFHKPDIRRWHLFEKQMDQGLIYDGHKYVPNTPNQARVFPLNRAKPETSTAEHQQKVLEPDSRLVHKSSSRKVNAEEMEATLFGKGILLDDILRLVIITFIIVLLIMTSMIVFLLHAQKNRTGGREFPDPPSSDDEPTDIDEGERIPLLTRERDSKSTINLSPSNHGLSTRSPSQESNVSNKNDSLEYFDTGQDVPLPDKNENGFIQKAERQELEPVKEIPKHDEEHHADVEVLEKKDYNGKVHYHELSNGNYDYQNKTCPKELLRSDYQNCHEIFVHDRNPKHSSGSASERSSGECSKCKTDEPKIKKTEDDQQSIKSGNFKKNSFRDLFRALPRKSKEKSSSLSSDDLNMNRESGSRRTNIRKPKIHPEQAQNGTRISGAQNGAPKKHLTEPKAKNERVTCPLNESFTNLVSVRVVQNEDDSNEKELEETICRHGREWTLSDDSEDDGATRPSWRRSNVHQMVHQYYHIAGMSERSPSVEAILSGSVPQRKSTVK